MRVTFWASDKPRERILADAFTEGCRAHGDQTEVRPLQPQIEVADCDIAVMVGVKSRELFRAHWTRGIHTVLLDKGYCRSALAGPVKEWEYWRVAVNGHHPTRYLMSTMRDFDRIERLHIDQLPWRKRAGNHILIAGSSSKYHEFYGLKHPNAWTTKLVAAIREFTDMPIVYRPKPSWREALPIDGTIWSGGDQSITQALTNAHVLITHGSNACFEAVCRGIPCIILGDGVAKPISDTEIKSLSIEAPLMCTPSQKAHWFANLAYCQWTRAEFASGDAWKIIKGQIYG